MSICSILITHLDCPIGTFSDAGQTCKECPIGLYGKNCLEKCICRDNKR